MSNELHECHLRYGSAIQLTMKGAPGWRGREREGEKERDGVEEHGLVKGWVSANDSLHCGSDLRLLFPSREEV